MARRSPPAKGPGGRDSRISPSPAQIAKVQSAGITEERILNQAEAVMKFTLLRRDRVDYLVGRQTRQREGAARLSARARRADT